MADAVNTGPAPTTDPRVAKADDTKSPLAIPLPTGTETGSESFWKDEITQAGKRRGKEVKKWKENLARYRGQKAKLPGLKAEDTINVNVDFYLSEQKKAQLFYQQPDIQLAPRQNQSPETTAMFREVLNYYLGPNEIDVEDLMDEVLCDVLVVSGIGATKIGFEEIKGQVVMPTGAVEPDPMNPGQMRPKVDPATGQPEVGPVMKRLYSRYFWERISPSKLLIPAGWTSCRYERAPWLGFEFDLDTDLTARTAQSAIGPGPRGGDGVDGDSLLSEDDKEFRVSGGKGWEIWYRAIYYDPTVKNPEKYRRLIIQEVDRERKVTVHEDSPYQRFDANGALVQGMRGNPIHLLTLRSLTDTAYPPSDCSVSRNQVDELSAGRSQMSLQRRRNLPMRGVDKGRLGKSDIDRLEKAEIQGLLLCDGDPDQVIKAIQTAQLPPENFQFAAVIQQDIEREWALGANQGSAPAVAGRSATEMSLIQRATDTRMTKERNRVLAFYTKGVEKVSTLLQLFADQTELIPIVGNDGTQQLLAWDKAKVAGRYVFTIRPDSSVRTDAAEEIERAFRAYNLMARDPHINRGELVKPLLVKLGVDPAKVWIDQLPPQHPEPPKPSLVIKADDLTLPTVVALLAQYGIQIPVQALASVPPPAVTPATQLHPSLAPHGGAAIKSQPVEQHEANLTGQPTGAPPLAH